MLKKKFCERKIIFEKKNVKEKGRVNNIITERKTWPMRENTQKKKSLAAAKSTQRGQVTTFSWERCSFWTSSWSKFTWNPTTAISLVKYFFAYSNRSHSKIFSKKTCSSKIKCWFQIRELFHLDANSIDQNCTHFTVKIQWHCCHLSGRHYRVSFLHVESSRVKFFVKREILKVGMKVLTRQNHKIERD